MFVTKRKHKKLEERCNGLQSDLETVKEYDSEILEQNSALIDENLVLKSRLNKVTQERDDYKESYESIDNVLTEESEQSSVEIRIDKDVQVATPIIRYNKAVVDSLIDNGYITFGQSDDAHAIQLGLAVVAGEVINQIVSAFEPEPDEVDYE